MKGILLTIHSDGDDARSYLTTLSVDSLHKLIQLINRKADHIIFATGVKPQTVRFELAN